MSLGEWNPTAGARWNVLRTALTKHYRVQLRYFRAVEVQDGKRRDDGRGRGALHLHLLVWSPRAMSARTIRRLGISAGFGHEVRLDRLAPGSKKAAYYVSKYVTKAADAREQVPWVGELVDPATGESYQGESRATYRTWSQSATWGKTLGEIRRAARAKWLAGAELQARGEAGGSATSEASAAPGSPLALAAVP